MRRVIIIICSILVVIILALLLVRESYKNSPDYNYITAKLDLKNKNIRIVNIGIRKTFSKDNQIDSIEAEYGFKNIYIGCDTTKEIITGLNNYNQVMEAYLKVRNGFYWRKNYQRMVDSLYQTAPQ